MGKQPFIEFGYPSPCNCKSPSLECSSNYGFFLPLKYFIFISFKCVCSDTCRGRKRALDFLELELQGVVSYLTWVLGTELGFLQEKNTLLSHLASPIMEYLEGG